MAEFKPGRVGPERIPPRQTFNEPRPVLNSLAAKAAGDPGEPPPPTAPTSLLAAYKKLRAEQLAKAALTNEPKDILWPSTAQVEAKALRKSRKRLAKHLREGVAPTMACHMAHQHYRSKGGKAQFATWAKKMAEGK